MKGQHDTNNSFKGFKFPTKKLDGKSPMSIAKSNNTNGPEDSIKGRLNSGNRSGSGSGFRHNSSGKKSSKREKPVYQLKNVNQFNP